MEVMNMVMVMTLVVFLTLGGVIQEQVLIGVDQDGIGWDFHRELPFQINLLSSNTIATVMHLDG